MSEELFRDTVITVAKQLQPEEGRELAYLYELPSKFQNPSFKPLDVLVQLENQQIITKSNSDTLARAMERIDRKDLASKVRKMHKRKKSSEKARKTGSTTISDEEVMQYQRARIRLTLWQAEIAAEGIRQILKSWNCQEAAHDMNAALRHCTNASESLKKATASFKLRELPFPAATEESSSDEDTSPHSSLTFSHTNTSNMRQGPKVSPKPSQKKKESPLTPTKSSVQQQQEDRHHHTQMCHGRIATPLVMVPNNEDDGIPEDTPQAPNEQDEDLYTTLSYTGDSGFSDSRTFLRVDPGKKHDEIGNRPPAPLPETETSTSSSSPHGYMTLRQEACTTSEYTTLVVNKTVDRSSQLVDKDCAGSRRNTSPVSNKLTAPANNMRTPIPTPRTKLANKRSSTIATTHQQVEEPIYANMHKHKQPLTPPKPSPRKDQLDHHDDEDTYTEVVYRN